MTAARRFSKQFRNDSSVDNGVNSSADNGADVETGTSAGNSGIMNDPTTVTHSKLAAEICQTISNDIKNPMPALCPSRLVYGLDLDRDSNKLTQLSLQQLERIHHLTESGMIVVVHGASSPNPLTIKRSYAVVIIPEDAEPAIYAYLKNQEMVSFRITRWNVNNTIVHTGNSSDGVNFMWTHPTLIEDRSVKANSAKIVSATNSTPTHIKVYHRTETIGETGPTYHDKILNQVLIGVGKLAKMNPAYHDYIMGAKILVAYHNEVGYGDVLDYLEPVNSL